MIGGAAAGKGGHRCGAAALAPSGQEDDAGARGRARSAPCRSAPGVKASTLERDGFVSRTVTPSVPVRVDYDLTPLGRDLMPVVRAVKTWAETHFDDVHAARARYDAEVVAA